MEKAIKEIKDAFERAAGSWKGLVDTERLIKDIYESRRIRAPEIKLVLVGGHHVISIKSGRR